MLFLGDYVDRGKKGFEVFMLLLCYQILYPKAVILLRGLLPLQSRESSGNHETQKINRIYGLFEEMQRKRTIATWRRLQDV